MSPAWRWMVLAAVAASWGASLALPALEAGGSVLRGHELLTRGWRGAEQGIIAWYANPLLLTALVAQALRAYRTAGVLSALSLLLALTSFAAGELARARGLAVPPLSFRFGFYVWASAPALLSAWSWYSVARSAPTGPPARRGNWD